MSTYKICEYINDNIRCKEINNLIKIYNSWLCEFHFKEHKQQKEKIIKEADEWYSKKQLEKKLIKELIKKDLLDALEKLEKLGD